MNLNNAEKMAVDLMAQHGLRNYSDSLGFWRFEFDNAKRRSGYCLGDVRIISMSKYYVRLNDESAVRNTILHEIAHALVGGEHHHDEVWRQKAIEIGSDGRRCRNAEETVTVPAPYEAVCPGCNRTVTAYRRPRRHKSCGQCNPQFFDTRFLLNFRRVR